MGAAELLKLVPPSLPRCYIAALNPASSRRPRVGLPVTSGSWRSSPSHLARNRSRRRSPPSTRRAVSKHEGARKPCALTAVMAVPNPGLWEKSAASIGSNSSTPSGDFSEIEATIYRLCDARSDDDGNRVALLSDLREYLPERWPCLISNFNVEVAKYEATSGAENQG